MKVLRINFALGMVLVSGLASAAPVQLLSNGGFETGNLTGWVTSGLGTTGTCPSQGRDWNVSSLPSATGCSEAGSPVSGVYAAYVMNDGGFANTTYTLSQSFVVSSGLTAAALSWSDSSVSNYSGAARLFFVDILKGTTLLANIYTYSVPLTDFDAGWNARSFDISSLLLANVGNTLTLRFSNSIPSVWTGPAGLGVDEVSLLANVSTVPEPATLFMLGLGLSGIVFSKRHKRSKAD